ncbi:hypothetical protein FQA39_LY02871 [Lamprigera yunnana]|nr:hypothetical protein FQA39_LY02871 [Lamprigera yunnana]
MFGSVSFVTVQFKILHLYLNRLIPLCQEEANAKNISQLRLREHYQFHMSNAIHYHSQITKVARELEDVLQGSILTYLMAMMILIGLDVYRGSMQSVTKMQLIQLAAEVSSSLGSVIIICYYGEELAFNSEKVGNVVFEMDFVGTDPSFQKDLMLIMRKSQNGLRLKPAGLVELSMNTAVWLIKSLRSADFSLYKDSLSRLIGWFFVFDQVHYARSLAVHMRELANLPQTHPDVNTNFEAGNFVAMKTIRAFSAIALDQNHEQVNACLKGDGGKIQYSPRATKT